MDQLVSWQNVFEQVRRDFPTIVPEVMLAVFGLAILFTDGSLNARQKSWNALTAMFGVAFSAAALWLMSGVQAATFDNSILVDPFFLFFGLIFLVLTALVILLSVRTSETEGEQQGLQFALMLFATTGMLFAACGNDLILLFVALETMAASFYVLSGFLRDDRRSNEGALKFVVTGVFSSAILAYGFSILYGLAGSTNLTVIARRIVERHSQWPADSLAYVAFAAIAAAILFKIAAAPFHQWAPDALEGAPAGCAAFVSIGSATAGFAVLLRLLLGVFWPLATAWIWTVAAVAVLSLTIGTFAAITQSNIKRLLAYSSIAQMGYVLLGLVAAVNKDGTLNTHGLRAAGYYLLMYAFFTTGAFGVVELLRRKGMAADELDDLNGLMRRSPVAAILMLIFLLSLAGVPLTAGFVGKLMVISALVDAQHTALAIVAVSYMLPAVYFYFRMIAAMWAREPADAMNPAMAWTQKLALGAMAAATLAAGIFPEQFVRFAQSSVPIPFMH
ncbi:MAG: NADH-quinone oxidoreductase subunit N [Candidatus Acidiferrales bacterium]